MDIYLIRHTQTDTRTGLCYGQTDVGLAENFRDEFIKIQKKLPELTSDCHIYSSPLTRCTQLASQLFPKVRNDDRLLELNFGAWENCTFDSVDAQVLQHWTDNFVSIGPPNGESFTQLCERVGGFWQELLLTDAEQVVLVTHAGVIRALLAHILQLPLANAFKFKVDVGSVHKLQYVNDYTHIHFLNQ